MRAVIAWLSTDPNRRRTLKKGDFSAEMKTKPAKTQPAKRRRERRRVLVALEYNDVQLHRGIVAYAHEKGWIVDLTMSRYGRVPDYWRGDGIVTLLLSEEGDVRQWIENARVPVVSLNADLTTGLPGVVLDHEAAGRMVASYFLERGLRHLVFFRCSDLPDIDGRQRGFEQTALEAGATCKIIDTRILRSDADDLARCLRSLPQPFGIMSQSDHRTPMLFAACEKAELAIPEQVVVIGVDNDEMVCELAPVPLSSVDSNRQRLAWEAAAMLDRLMNGEKPPKSPVIVEPLGIVHRKSSDLLAIQHRGVASALKFLWANYHKPINVNDIVQHVLMSRCGLYRAFETHVGRSIGDELLRLRVEHAKRLLATTTMKMYAVAKQSGFSGPEHFSKSFHRALGVTPSEYRRRNALCRSD